MTKLSALTAAGCLLVIVAAFVSLRGCAGDFIHVQRESGRAEVAAGVREVSHNATVRQLQRNNDAASRWRDAENVLSASYEPYYAAIRDFQPGPIPSGNGTAAAPAPDSGLDSLVPAAVERDLRLRVAKTNDAICAGGSRSATATCAAWAEARASFLSARGLTWRRLALYAGQCLEVIALNDNDKAVVMLSLDGGAEGETMGKGK